MDGAGCPCEITQVGEAPRSCAVGPRGVPPPMKALGACRLLRGDASVGRACGVGRPAHNKRFLEAQQKLVAHFVAGNRDLRAFENGCAIPQPERARVGQAGTPVPLSLSTLNRAVVCAEYFNKK
jgi:hypothetical protein